LSPEGPSWPWSYGNGFTTTYAINAYHRWCLIICLFITMTYRDVGQISKNKHMIYDDQAKFFNLYFFSFLE
jgi:hypothetical protein